MKRSRPQVSCLPQPSARCVIISLGLIIMVIWHTFVLMIAFEKLELRNTDKQSLRGAKACDCPCEHPKATRAGSPALQNSRQQENDVGQEVLKISSSSGNVVGSPASQISLPLVQGVAKTISDQNAAAIPAPPSFRSAPPQVETGRSAGELKISLAHVQEPKSAKNQTSHLFKEAHNIPMDFPKLAADTVNLQSAVQDIHGGQVADISVQGVKELDKEETVDELRATVIVLWRESMSLTIPSLREVLTDPVIPLDVIYIHLNYSLCREVLDEAMQLQAEFPNLHIVVLQEWKNRHEMLREALPLVKTRWVAVHDNNNRGLPRDWIKRLIHAASTTHPAPLLVAPLINAVDKQDLGHTQDHHPIISVVLVTGDNSTALPNGGGAEQDVVLCWTGTSEGVRLSNPDMAVVAGNAVETHSYLVDADRVDLASLYNPHNSFASYHIGFGLHLAVLHGVHASAVVPGLEYSYMYPNTHMGLRDVPFAVVRWNAWDNMHSILYLEQLYGVRYFHEAGFDWHSRAAFFDTLFDQGGEPLTSDPGLIAALTASVYALDFMNHFAFPRVVDQRWESQPYLDGLKSCAEQPLALTPRALMDWLNRNEDRLLAGQQLVVGAGKEPLPSRAAFVESVGLGEDEMQRGRRWVRENLAQFPAAPFGAHEVEKIRGSKDFDAVVDKESVPDLLWVQGSFPPGLHAGLVNVSSMVLQQSRGGGAGGSYRAFRGTLTRYLIRLSSAPEARKRRRATRRRSEKPRTEPRYRRRQRKVVGVAEALGHAMCEGLAQRRTCEQTRGALEVLWTAYLSRQLAAGSQGAAAATGIAPGVVVGNQSAGGAAGSGGRFVVEEGEEQDVAPPEVGNATLATTSVIFDSYGRSASVVTAGVLPLWTPGFELVSWGSRLELPDRYRRAYDSSVEWQGRRGMVVTTKQLADLVRAASSTAAA